MDLNINELLGKQLVSITGRTGDDAMTFTTSNGEEYQLYHEQDCWESVSIEEIIGDLGDLINSTIVEAEEVHGGDDPAGWEPGEYTDSYTWTFYKLRTANGCVTIRWLGESNGYYGESVSFTKLKKGRNEN